MSGLLCPSPKIPAFVVNYWSLLNKANSYATNAPSSKRGLTIYYAN